MEITVEPSKTYAVTTSGSCTVTDADGLELCTASSGSQAFFVATTPTVTISDDGAKVSRATFNCALAVAGLLGGGAEKLPAGYTRVEWLSSMQDRKQTIDTGIVPTASTGLYVEYTGLGGNSVMSCQSFPSSTMFGFVNGGYRWNSSRDYTHSNTNVVAELNMFGDHTFKQLKPSEVSVELPELNFTPRYPLGMFSQNYAGKFGDEPFYGRISRAKIFDGKNKLRDFVAALDPTGTPCMFDTVSKTPFKNVGSGQFIAGVGTVAQLTILLRNLPATGGTLTLSLPAEANTPEVAEALQACHDTKGWTLTVHEYRPAAVATYSLRRVREVVWCRKVQAEHGSYVDSTGTRWQVEWCAAIFGPKGQDPTAYGYEPFDSVEEAAESWGLVPYVDPHAEMGTEPETELEL